MSGASTDDLTPEDLREELVRLRKENAALREAGSTLLTHMDGIVEAEVVRLRGQIRAIMEALRLEGNQLWQGAEYHDVGEFIMDELLPRLEAVLREEK